MKHSYLVALLFVASLTYGQKYNFDFHNRVYDVHTRSVEVLLNDVPTLFPILKLGSSDYISLHFDDMLNEERILFYRLVHCDKDWTPSTLRENEYLAGFNDERLRNYEYSENTRSQYIHYWKKFPNEDTQFRVSGNYLLIIYEEDIAYPILTQRFIVMDPQVGVEITSIFPADIDNIRFKQELQVNLNYENFPMRNALEEVSIVMLQNENWDNYVESKPTIFSGNILRFNRLRTFEFWGLSEFRQFDTRRLMVIGRGVQKVDRKIDAVYATLYRDESRARKVHLAEFDFNGRFYIENFERPGGRDINNILNLVSFDNVNPAEISQARITALNIASRAQERNFMSEYVHVTFTLDDDIFLERGQNIYVLGAMNNWEPREEFRMKYDAQTDMYVTTALLKQGFYNYYYGILDSEGNIDYKTLEGTWNETENDYQAIVYYRGIGDIYDRVIGFLSYNTNSDLFNLR